MEQEPKRKDSPICQGETAAGRITSNAPPTPRKTPSHCLDYSTPRKRYGGEHVPLPNPNETPTKSAKRPALTALDEVAPRIDRGKRRHTAPEDRSPQSSSLVVPVPTFELHDPFEAPQPLAFSADELKRTAEAVLSQVNWEDVQKYVASNRGTASYRKAIKSILEAELNRLSREEKSNISSK